MLSGFAHNSITTTSKYEILNFIVFYWITLIQFKWVKTIRTTHCSRLLRRGTATISKKLRWTPSTKETNTIGSHGSELILRKINSHSKTAPSLCSLRITTGTTMGPNSKCGGFGMSIRRNTIYSLLSFSLRSLWHTNPNIQVLCWSSAWSIGSMWRQSFWLKRSISVESTNTLSGATVSTILTMLTIRYLSMVKSKFQRGASHMMSLGKSFWWRRGSKKKKELKESSMLSHSTSCKLLECQDTGLSHWKKR